MSDILFGPASRLAMAACALAASAGAQSTWIVDASNGPGTDFTDLPTAVATVAAGDTLRVRTGSYASFVTDKPLRILGEGAPTTFGVGIVGIPAGARFVLAGIDVLGFLGSGRVGILDNAGAVYFDRVRMVPEVDLTIERSADVTLHAVDLTDIATFVDSSVTLAATTITARSFASGGIPAPPAFDAIGCTVLVTGSDLEGTRSVGLIGPLRSNPGPVFRLQDSTLSLDRRSAARAAVGVVGTGVRPTPAIEATRSDIILDPAAVVTTTSPNTPAVVSDRPPRIWPTPSVAGDGVDPGGTLTAVLSAPAGAPAAMLLGLPSRPTALTPFGFLAVDPAAAEVLAIGTVPADGLRASIAVPAAIRPGTIVTLQGATAENGILGLGNPATIVLHGR